MERIDPQKANLQKILNTKGEYLTHCFYKDPAKNFTFYVPLQQLIREQSLRKRKFSCDSIYACIIQSTYMAFVSSFYRINLQLGELVVDKRDSAVSSPTPTNEPINVQLAYTFEINGNAPKMDFLSYVNNQILNILLKIRTIQNLANDTGLRVFTSQFQKLRQIEWQRQREKQFMLCLQETELFRKHSMLLKIKNCSVINLMKERNPKLSELKKIERDLVDTHNSYSRANEFPVQMLRESEKSIQRNTKEFFVELFKNDCKVISDNSEDSYHLKLEIKHAETKYNFEAGVYGITGITLTPPVEKGQYKLSQLEFLIEYSAERNSICVKLITGIVVQVDTSDFLMFQCNNLSFDSCNVNLEFIDRPSQQGPNQKQRVIAFKTTSCFTRKEPPIQKILLLIDIVVITFKTLEPELLKSTVTTKDYNRAKELHMKVKHFIAILNFVSKKVNSMKEESSSKNRN